MMFQHIVFASLAILTKTIGLNAWPDLPGVSNIPDPNTILDFTKPYKELYSELKSLFSANNILSQLQDLVGNLDGVKQVEGFINDGGLAKLGKMMEDDVLNEIVEFMDDQIVEQTTKLTNEVADSLIGKYGTMKDIYEQQMEPTFRDIESKILDFSFESLLQELAGLIPEGLVKFYEHPDQVIVGYVENELLNLNKSVTSAAPKDIVEKFENLANYQKLQVNVEKFVTDNGLVKAGTQLFHSANQTFHAVKEGFDRPDAVLDKIVDQIKNVIESTVFRKIMDSWNRLQPYEKVMNMVEKVNLVERYNNLTSDEGLVELAKEVFGGNASQTIIDLATNTKLHDQIVKLEME